MEYELKDLLVDKGYIRGPFGSALRRREMKESGIPVYEQKNAIENSREFRYFIDTQKYEELKRFQVQTNDIIISCSGTVGKVSIIKENDEKGIISQALLILRANTRIINTKFLYYYFSSDKGRYELIRRSSGSVQVNIAKREIIEKIKIRVPSLNNQKKIVNILDSIDSKIILNESIIANLEELSQTLFKRWFVDFDFPNDFGEPYSSSGGEFVKSNTNDLPKNWSIVDLDEICEVRDGTHESPKETNEGFPLVTSKHLKYYQLDLQGAKLISNDDYLKVNKRSKVHTNDILISMIGTIGRLYYVLENEINYAIKNIGLIKTSQTNYPDYIYLSFKASQIKSYIENRSAGSTQQYISLTELRKIPIINPPTEILGKFSIITTPIFKKIRDLVEENDTLIVLRDTLLPKLMSGEIELPDELEVDEHAEFLQ